jgi:hypothetical protein
MGDIRIELSFIFIGCKKTYNYFERTGISKPQKFTRNYCNNKMDSNGTPTPLNAIKG